MNTKILPESILSKVKKNKAAYRLARGSRAFVGSVLGSRAVPGVVGKVHFNDFMLVSTEPEDTANYMRCSRETVDQLTIALASAGKTWADIGSVLEFGCGYGRITRTLVQNIRPDKVTVCDTIAGGAKFCAQEFQVNTLVSTGDINSFQAAPSDLVFFLSVHTHLSARRLKDLQRKLKDLLNPGGICFFTTMGLTSAQNAGRYGDRWLEQKSQILSDLNTQGLSFYPYGYYDDADYGMTWETYDHASETLRRLHGDSMRLLEFPDGRNGAHDGHQDIHVYQRLS